MRNEKSGDRYFGNIEAQGVHPLSRVYLDWNATAPLRPEARDAMIAAMDVVGNPSSVHAEGRKAKAIVETARTKIAALTGADANELVFTSGATEISAILVETAAQPCVSSVEHDAFFHHGETLEGSVLPVDASGQISNDISEQFFGWVIVQSANSETGIVQDLTRFKRLNFVDVTQSVGKTAISLSWMNSNLAGFSGHKIGGPKGIGALYVKNGDHIETLAKGGGQEQGRRSGTENVIGIAGFGAAAEAAQRDLDNGLWESVRELRDQLEARLADAAPDAIFVGQQAQRLPNTSCIAVPGWKGETQVMQMDLAGYAISAGSACSSGKVKRSRVLTAMGFDDITASSAIRVSFGPTTTEDEVMGFADAWIAQYKKFKARAA